ncbi:MAG: hypothetical protein SCK29_09670 [Bacillota bacterium]|nr:hypothetical protein [Bacillota bacterium]MDW7684368.1 hypothetical protein [Bacillota bacterium]
MTQKRIITGLAAAVIILLVISIYQFSELRAVKRRYGGLAGEMFLSLRWFEFYSAGPLEEMQKDNLQKQQQAAISFGESLKYLDNTVTFFNLIGVDSIPVKMFQDELRSWNGAIKAQLLAGNPLTDTQKLQAKRYSAQLARITEVVTKIMYEYSEGGSMGNAILMGEEKLFDYFEEVNGIFTAAPD